MRIKMKQKPTLGNIETVTKFLLFPKCINREWRWLERASYKREWDAVPVGGRNCIHTWVNLEWED